VQINQTMKNHSNELKPRTQN